MGMLFHCLEYQPYLSLCNGYMFYLFSQVELSLEIQSDKPWEKISDLIITLVGFWLKNEGEPPLIILSL